MEIKKSKGISLNTDIHLLLKNYSPYFANTTLSFFDKSKYRNYKQEYISPEHGVVCLQSVVGTTHPDYRGKTWLDLLPKDQNQANQGILKRGWKRLYDLRNNPGYYIDSSPKNHISFYKVGNEYYIADGNHRVIIGRFFLHLNNLPEVIAGVGIYKFPEIIEY